MLFFIFLDIWKKKRKCGNIKNANLIGSQGIRIPYYIVKQSQYSSSKEPGRKQGFKQQKKARLGSERTR